MVWQAHEAKQRFSEVVRRAEQEGPQVVTRHGDEVVVVMSAKEFHQMRGDELNFRDFLLSGPRTDDLDIERDRSILSTPRDFHGRRIIVMMAVQTRFHGFRPFANRYVNPITRRFAEWVPGLAIITYRGRKTGRVYHLPLNLFRNDGAWVVFLTYGSGAQWVQNVLAQGGCEMRKRGRTVQLVHPELIVDPARSLVPAPVRVVGRIGGVTEFLRLHPA